MPQTHKLSLGYNDGGGGVTLWTWGQGYMPVLTGVFPDGYPIWIRLATQRILAMELVLRGATTYTFGLINMSPTVTGGFVVLTKGCKHEMHIPVPLLRPLVQRLRVIRLGEVN